MIKNKSCMFIFWLFIIGSFLGFIHENLLTLIKGHYELRQGLIYEPLIPIYGFGLLVFYFVYSKINLKNLNKFKKFLLLFFIGFFMGGVIEYLCSYFQEKIFGTISWDYSYLKFNFNGRTSLFHASCWGIIGILFYEFLFPIIQKGKIYLTISWVKIITIFLSILFILDVSISTFACLRQEERRKKIEATNSIQKWLDKKYPDEYLNKIYNNAKEGK